MRVLTVGNLYPPHHQGGYELVWSEAVGYLRSRGHEVRILASDHIGGEPAGEDDPDVHRELGWYWRDHRWPRIGPLARVRMERRNAAILQRHLDEFRPDVVGWWSMGGMSLSLIERVRRLGLPAAGFVCEGWLDYGPKVDAWMRMAGRPLAAPAAERLTGIPATVGFEDVGPWLFPSRMLEEHGHRVRGLRDTRVVHQGVDREVFTEAPRPEWRWRLLYVGRIDPRKGIDLAIRALASLPAEASLDVVGGGDDEHLSDLRSLASDSGLEGRVRFHGPEPRERVRDRYAEADAVIFPVTWNEPWGLVPLEAMAVGAPVVATGRGGSGEYLRHDANSLLFDPDDGPGALAGALAALAEDPALRRKLTAGGSGTAGTFGRDDFSAAVEETLLRAVA